MTKLASKSEACVWRFKGKCSAIKEGRAELITRPKVLAGLIDDFISSRRKTGFEATTTNIYNDYIVNLACHAKGGGCAVGLTYR